MQDFYAECEASKEKRFSAIGALALKRQQLSVDVEHAQVAIKELDAEIAAHQTVVNELAIVQRNFNSWLAVHEGALTAEQVAAGIQSGMNGAEAEPVPIRAHQEENNNA